MPLADLITADFAQAQLGLDARRQAQLPAVVAAASRAIRRHCNRRFVRGVWDELYTADGPRSAILLDEFPVNRVVAVRVNPTAVLEINCPDDDANQDAAVELVATGTADAGQVVTGIVLTRTSLGEDHEDTITFADLDEKTVRGLAGAIGALPGWTASPVAGYEKRAVADLRQIQGASPALGTQSAKLVAHVDRAPFQVEEKTGVLTIDAGEDSPFGSIRFGPYLATDVDDMRVWGRPGGVRVTYDAGFDPVPEDVREAAVLMAKSMIDNRRRDFTATSERWEDYEKRLNWADQDHGIPAPAREILARYVNHRA